MLELRDVHVTFHPGTANERPALRGVSLTVRAGETVTVVGPNGCGKSTLLAVVSGALLPTGGQIHIDGRDVTGVPEHRRSAFVARVVDDPRAGTAPALDVGENLAFALRGGRRRLWRRALGPDRRRAAVTALTALGLGLEHRLDDPVGSLSAGQRQSLSMVMAAVTEPTILLLDEHLAALDPRTASRVRALTVDLVTRLGCTTLMVTHNMHDAIEVGDRLIVLKEGRVAADFDGDHKRGLNATQLSELVAGEAQQPTSPARCAL